MRHRCKTVKLQRKKAHRERLLANLAIGLIQQGRIKTTLAKAKALRPYAERLLTFGKRGTVHTRRLAYARLGSSAVSKQAVKKLFDTIAPEFADRQGGYTRIIQLGTRQSDAAPMAFIEWVDYVLDAEEGDELVTKADAKKEEKAATAAAAS